MIDHLGVNVDDMEAAASFYDTVLATLGHRRLVEYPGVIGYGTDEPTFWISGAAEGASNRECHVAFRAADRAQVEAFVAAAQTSGAEVLHAPREWPEYHPGYYGGFVRDPDGNNVEAVVHH